jgi:hypothetical protein
LAFGLNSHAQQADQKDYYNWFDDQVGIENTGLFNGIRYKELYRIKNGKHKFYKSPDFQNAHLFYDGQPYYDIPLKYDLFEDQLIISLQTGSGSSIMQLLKEEVTGFELDNKRFVHLKGIEVYKSKDQINGFYEVLEEGTSLTLYKKHRKLRKKVLENKAILNEFRNDDLYYVLFENLFYPIKSKNDLVKIFPQRKKQINAFFSGNKYLMDTDYDLFMTQIADRIDDALTTKPSES